MFLKLGQWWGMLQGANTQPYFRFYLYLLLNKYIQERNN